MISLLISLLMALFVPIAVTAEDPAGGSASGSVVFEAPPDEVESFLKNAATAMESYAVVNGSYEGATFELLEREGLRTVGGISLEIVRADDLGYCLEASAMDGSSPYLAHYDSDVGSVESGGCAG